MFSRPQALVFAFSSTHKVPPPLLPSTHPTFPKASRFLQSENSFHFFVFLVILLYSTFNHLHYIYIICLLSFMLYPGGRNHVIMVLYTSHPSVVLKGRRVKESNSIPICFTYIISLNLHNNSMKHYYPIIHFAEKETEAQRSSTSIPKTRS